MTTEKTASNIYVAILARALDRYDIDIKNVLLKCSPDGDIKKYEDSRIAADSTVELWGAAKELSCDPRLPLKTGIHIHPSDYGVISYALLNCNDFHEMLDLICEYKSLLNESLTSTLTQDHGMYVYTLFCETEGAQDLVEFDFSSMLYMAYIAAGNSKKAHVKIERIEFSHQPQTDMAFYQECFKCEVAFNKSHNKMYLSEAAVKQKSIAPNLSAHYIFLELTRKIAKKEIGKSNLIDKIERYIYELLAQQQPISLDGTAAHLNHSSSTLKRELANRGTSFSTLKNRILKKEAESLLAKDEVSVSDVSHILQFSTASSFQRAFKRWTGQSPTQFKKGLR